MTTEPQLSTRATALLDRISRQPSEHVWATLKERGHIDELVRAGYLIHIQRGQYRKTSKLPTRKEPPQ